MFAVPAPKVSYAAALCVALSREVHNTKQVKVSNWSCKAGPEISGTQYFVVDVTESHGDKNARLQFVCMPDGSPVADRVLNRWVGSSSANPEAA